MADYKIELGIGLNQSQLNQTKQILESIESQKRDVVYNVDFNIKNVDKLIKVGDEIEKIKGQLKSNKNAVPIDTKNVENSLTKIHESIKKLQNAFGRVDSKKGTQSLLTTINKINTALGEVSKQFGDLNRNLSNLTSKDFSLNFDFGFSNSSKNPEQAIKELNMLKKEVEEYENYFRKHYSLEGSNTDPINRLVRQYNQRSQLYGVQLQQAMSSGSDAQKISAYKEYIKLIRETAAIGKISLDPVDFRLAESGEFVKVRNEASETQKQLQELFSGGINAENLHRTLDDIASDLRKIQESLGKFAEGFSVNGLTTQFEQLSKSIEQLVQNASQVKAVLGDGIGSGIGNVVNTNANSVNNIEKISDDATAAVVQNEKKKREAYKATTDTVLYHAGVVSKLNKSETNGKMEKTRGTGYYGTGHYFVDYAHKHELDSDRSFNAKPYTSVDSSYYNLFDATNKEVADKLHTFLHDLTMYTKGIDGYDISGLFAQFKDVFGNTIMDVKEFGSRLDALKSFMLNSMDMFGKDDRSDSVSTQFMKSLGYEGVDTRGTRYADTTYGTVIYDLKEESILQANITDELQKQGQMLEKINYAKGQVFDKGEDERIQGILDQQAKQREIDEEFKRSFDTTNLNKAEADLKEAQSRLKETQEIIANCQKAINNVDQEYKNHIAEMSEMGFDKDFLLSVEDEESWKKSHSEDYQNRIDELTSERSQIQSEISALEEVINREQQLANEARERAKQTVEQRHLEAQQAQESANAVVQGEERKQQAIKKTDIELKASKEHFENIDSALEGYGFSKSAVDSIKNDFKDLGITVKQVTTQLNDDGSIRMTVQGVDSLENAVTHIKNVRKVLNEETNELEIRVTDTTKVKKSFDEVEQSFKKLKSLAKEMGDIDLKIANLEANGEIEDANSLKRVLNELESEYKELHNVANQNLSGDQVKELDQIFANTTGKVRAFKQELSESAEAQKFAAGFERLKSITKEIASLQIDLFNFDDEGNINRTIAQIEKLESEASELRAELQKEFPNASLEEIDDIARKGVDALDKLANKAAEVKARLAKDIKIDIEHGNYDNQISQMDEKFNKLSNAGKELRESVEQVKNAYREMENALQGTGDGVVDRERLIQAEQKYAAALEKTNNLIRIQSRVDKADNDRLKLDDDIKLFQADIDKWLVTNSAATKKFGGTMLDLKAKAEGVDRITLNGLIRQFKLADKEAEKLGLKTQSVGDKIKTKFKEYSTYLSAAEVFMWAEQALRSMFEQVKLIDSAMTELKKVTNETDAAYNKFLTNAATRSREIGTTIDGLVSSTADFARLGYGFEDAQGLAEVANIYAVVGDEVEGVQGATESLISTMAAFKGEMNGMSNADFAMSIIDVYNELGNSFAISSGGLGEALERSASSLAAANNTLHESAAMITAANEVTQNPEKVGNAMKTISMRIRGKDFVPIYNENYSLCYAV